MEIKTFGETIAFGIFAMGIVFSVLALLGFVISLFKVIFYKEGKVKRGVLKVEEKLTEEPKIVANTLEFLRSKSEEPIQKKHGNIPL